MTEKEPNTAEPEKRTVVERDVTFHRSVADVGLVFDLGRDVEISFLQNGPAIAAKILLVRDSEEDEGFEMRPSLTEVSRVRMSPQSALAMAIMVLESLAESGRVKNELVLEKVKSLFEDASNDRPEE